MVSLREELVSIYRDAVRSLAGNRLVCEALAGTARPGRLSVLALGKAAGSMLRGAQEAWGPLQGLAVAHAGSEIPQGIEFVAGEHPVPGRGSLQAGARVLDFVRALGPEDELLVLLSGGGSALAELPAEGLTLADLQATTKRLLGGGVSIDRINAVRKHLSQLKGGRLGAACGAGRIRVFTLSDVAGDDPRVIASGPFAPDDSTCADALAVIEGLAVPPAVRAHLERGAETPKKPDPRIEQRILAGPLDLPRAAAKIARERGFAATALDHFVGGDVEVVASRWAAFFAESHPPGTLLAVAAEPTVILPREAGTGGRSQHLALRVALSLAGRRDAAFLAAGSDGRDGNSDNAGAAVDGCTVADGEVEIGEALAHAASAAACARVGACIPAWETGTNLADLHLLAIGHAQRR